MDINKLPITNKEKWESTGFKNRIRIGKEVFYLETYISTIVNAIIDNTTGRITFEKEAKVEETFVVSTIHKKENNFLNEGILLKWGGDQFNLIEKVL